MYKPILVALSAVLAITVCCNAAEPSLPGWPFPFVASSVTSEDTQLYKTYWTLYYDSPFVSREDYESEDPLVGAGSTIIIINGGSLQLYDLKGLPGMWTNCLADSFPYAGNGESADPFVPSASKCGNSTFIGTESMGSSLVNHWTRTCTVGVKVTLEDQYWTDEATPLPVRLTAKVLQMSKQAFNETADYTNVALGPIKPTTFDIPSICDG